MTDRNKRILCILCSLEHDGIENKDISINEYISTGNRNNFWQYQFFLDIYTRTVFVYIFNLKFVDLVFSYMEFLYVYILIHLKFTSRAGTDVWPFKNPYHRVNAFPLQRTHTCTPCLSLAATVGHCCSVMYTLSLLNF